MLGLFKRAPADLQYELAEINGRTGLIVRQNGAAVVAIMADVVDGKVAALWAMRNPDKLQGL
jgi:RNA polymerase sigma-70 factor (ECF subfamily)